LGRTPYGAWLLAGAFCLLALLMLISFSSGNRTNNKVMSSGLAIVAFTIIAAAATSWSNSFQWSLPAPFYLGLAPFSVSVDRLSCFFLLLLGISAASVAAFSPGYLNHLKSTIHGGIYWTCLSTFVAAMALVLTAANGIAFLVFWELMSLSSVALVASDHAKHRTQRAAFIYLGATRIATLLLTAGFIWMHALTNSWDFSSWLFTDKTTLGPALLIFLGFCIKSGFWPFHHWLPYAHPEAPAPVSALMSGVMVKVALYGIIRLLIAGQCTFPIVGFLGLLLSTVSAGWGVLFALMERDLKRMLAYSTVENVGLIGMGLSLCIICRHTEGLLLVAAMALIGAMLHCLNHGVFKSLLFLGAGAVDASVHSRDMNILGGLAKRMPWTMATFFVGSIAICAMPPLNGFGSKWILYQSLLQWSYNSESPTLRALALLLVGALSFVGALSLACFTKAIGITFLGKPRSEAAAHARECTPAMRLSLSALSALCLIFGLALAEMVIALQPFTEQLGFIGTRVVQLLLPPQIMLLFATVTGIALGLGLHWLALSKDRPAIRSYNTWDCGYGPLTARTEETASSFSRPIALIFKPLLQYRFATQIEGKDRRHFPEEVVVETYFVPLIETYVYRPALAVFGAISRLLVNLQTGSIHVHLLYVFVTLLLLILIGTTL
jgi:hydrogenase-4 component B